MRRITPCPLCANSGHGPALDEHSDARQDNPDFGELAGLRLDLDRAAMLLDDDVVADREAKPGTFSGRLGREERIEHLLLHLGRNAGAVVADPDFHAVAKVLGRGGKGRLVVAAIGFCFALGRRIKAIGNQIEQNPRDVLREHIDLAGGRIEGPLQGDVEALLLGPRAVVGEIEALLDEGVDIDRPVLTRAFTRVQQHVLDDGIGALAVLHDLVEIALQRIRQFVDFARALIVEVGTGQGVLQFVDQFAGDAREIVDEIERVLDLVRDAGGELTERGELFGLHQAVLCGAQVLQRFRQFAGAGLHIFEQVARFQSRSQPGRQTFPPARSDSR